MSILPHPELRDLRTQLQKILGDMAIFGPVIPKPPVLDSSADIHAEGEGLPPESVPGLRALRDTVKRDLAVLEKFLADPKSASLPPLSTNAPYLIAVWHEVLLAPQPITTVWRTYHDNSKPAASRTRGSQKPPGIKVDVVADNGRRWIRVNTVKNSRLLAEFREMDSYLTDSEDELDDPNALPALVPAEFDNSVLKMGRALLAAADHNRLPGTNDIPAVTLRLTRLDPSPANEKEYDPRIQKTVQQLQDMGIDVELGERDATSVSRSMPAHPSHPRRLEPTMHINLDLSILIALVSDITHAPLPQSAEEANSRFIPPPEYREWKKKQIEATKGAQAAAALDGEAEQGLGKHSRALSNQALQEMDQGLLQDIHDRLSSLVNESADVSSLAQVEFWTTPEARDRFLRIVLSKIGGANEQRRARALFACAASMHREEAEEAYWQGSRYPHRFIPLHPIRVFPSPEPDASHEQSWESEGTASSPFFRVLARTCREVLAQEAVPDSRERTPVGEGGTPEECEEEIGRAAVTRGNPRLTAHTVQSVLWGAVRGWTTLTANKASVRAVLREMRARGLSDGWREEVDVGEGAEKAALWVVDPRSLAEGMRWETVFILAVVSLASSALAAPTHQLVRRDAGPAALAIWIPILSVVAAVAAGTVIYRYRKNRNTQQRIAAAQTATEQTLTARFRTWTSRPVAVPGAQGQTRELTAEQLAGGNIPARTRRHRPRSTASTRSTRSLPLYMKEPGEEEVVVFRGRAELTEDGSVLATGGLAPVDESGEQTPNNSIDLRRSRGASVSSMTPGPDTPLLEESHLEDSGDPSLPPALSRIRPSVDTVDDDDGSVEEPLMADQEDERGPAPSYLDAVNSIDSGIVLDDSVDDHTSRQYPPQPAPTQRSGTLRSIGALRPGLFGRSESSVTTSASAPTPPLESVPVPEHNGRLSSLLHRFTPGQRQHASSDATPPVLPPSPLIPNDSPHRRTRGATVSSPTPPPGSPTPSHYRTHRPSTSGSASGLSVMFRTRSNTSVGAADRLRSPSTISLHSISAPLTHTVVRTEYTYPRSGPTPDQMKLIASVESFKRFGVPYGPDALAFASASRVDLVPPPVFEEVVEASGESESSASSGTEPSSGSGSGSGEGTASTESTVPTSQEVSSVTQDDTVDVSATELQPQEPQEQLAAKEVAPEVCVSDSDQLADEEAKTVSAKPPALPPLTAEDVKKILRPLAPPTSFKPTSPKTPVRPGSRASSHATFATAEESFGGDSLPATPNQLTITITDDDEPPLSVAETSNTDESATPVTPRNMTRTLNDDENNADTTAPLHVSQALSAAELAVEVS
ncbi:uncharacterized protein FIBRA_01078 [Fibroporia radiculosa]|uniref:Uncharacterized protein n=1 Tax=Fibroporia radiculosa TaxID=599839 RepID=J4I8A4_9APHY|nr:uncharacterized protein FIBRA_01078 [Fibroporia radiculosa]CCL99066.1 predicted protein [Fibroporia radiculosa]